MFHSNSMASVSKWLASESGWVKLNTNGKDEVFRIEARSMLEGLRLTWDKGYQQVQLESDNALLVELMLVGESIDSHIVELRAIHKLLHRNWKVCIHLTSGAHNEVADFIAKYVAIGFTSIKVFFIPPQGDNIPTTININAHRLANVVAYKSSRRSENLIRMSFVA
ncbi:hypothetical protein J1N35_018063 [Gossypium stocksii]|uniref:RNase H type-1 domain-containing protein n=1 Tax=Gossypium stocksii TaxID=47602 RepID=A0A9D4A6U0_9ROSI|nr:hypothetical protein J1N35_018063 [Gossypium stocksii]